MKATHLLFIALTLLVVAGCNQREKELEQEKAGLLLTADSLTQVIAQRDTYFDEVVRMIDQIHSSLEGVREEEVLLMKESGESPGKLTHTTYESRTNLVHQIARIDTTLKQNRKQIAKLQAKVKSFQKEFASLNGAIENLKKNLEERERNIAMLESKVSGLEDEVAQKAQMIVDRDAVINTQQTELSTVFYISGTRDELEEMGIIEDEGGFPWGLFGSTTVLASGVHREYFKEFDKNKERVITVEGTIDDIVPKRSEGFYALSQIDDSRASLNITDPGMFWQDSYLVIITD